MKSVLYADSSIENVPRNAEEVYLARPLKIKKLEKLLKRSPIKKIFLSNSSSKRLPSKTKKFLQEKEIELVLDSRRGRAIELDLQKIAQLRELKEDGRSYREIEKELFVPKSTCHYIVKYADRSKVKNGKNTIILD